MPSVTNVNHACILSGRWPAETQIAGNYYYDPETRAEALRSAAHAGPKPCSSATPR